LESAIHTTTVVSTSVLFPLAFLMLLAPPIPEKVTPYSKNTNITQNETR
jgi:hypothetical protein